MQNTLNVTSALEEIEKKLKHKELLIYKRPQTTKSKRTKKSCDSPVPEFAREYVYNYKNSFRSLPRSSVSTGYQSKASFANQEPLEKKTAKIQVRKRRAPLNSSVEVKEPTLHKILRMYRPQIFKFRDKSHIKLFTTVSLEVKKSQSKLVQNSLMLERLRRKPRKTKKKPAVSEKKAVILDYETPAFTFGEKLWRLNEVSIINLDNKEDE